MKGVKDFVWMVVAAGFLWITWPYLGHPLIIWGFEKLGSQGAAAFPGGPFG
jgi:hypothetical protein